MRKNLKKNWQSGKHTTIARHVLFYGFYAWNKDTYIHTLYTVAVSMIVLYSLTVVGQKRVWDTVGLCDKLV